MMRVRPNTILLKDSVTTENLIPIFQHNGKHFFDINSMIECSFIQDYQERYTLGTDTQLNHYFRWEFSSLLNGTFLYRHQHDLVSTSEHFESYRHYQCQRTSHPKREFSGCLLFENLFELNLQMFFRLIF